MRRRWSALFGPDPGLMRLRTALRAWLSVVLAAAILGLLVWQKEMPALAAAIGVSFALMGATLPREASPRARLETLLAMLLSGLGSTLLCLWLSRWPLLAEAGFLVCVVATVAVQGYGPRHVAAGIVVLLDFYLVLFLRGSPAEALACVLSLGVSLAVVLLVCLVILPERPQQAFNRMLVSVRRSAATVLHAVAAREEGDAGAGRLRRRRLLAELNAMILAAEEQLAVFDPAQASGLGPALLRFEVAITDVAVAAGVVTLQRADRARLRLAAMRLLAGRRSRLRRRGDKATALSLSLARLEAAADLSRADIALPPPQRRGNIAASPKPSPAWQPAIRAGVAALLAMAGGYALSPDRWFWSVQTAYLMFLGTRSRGDTFLRSVQRVWGTLAGLAAGLGVSVVLGAHPMSEGIGIAACLFALAYVFGASQTLSVFFITVLLSLAYSLGGAPTGSVLLLRLEETAVGAAAAVLVGLFLLPKPTHSHVAETGRKTLAALADVLRACARQVKGEDGVSPTAAMRQADRLLRDLRLALAPLRAGFALAPWVSRNADLPAFLVCVFWTRHLAAECAVAGDSDEAGVVAARIEAIARKLDALSRPEDAAGGGSAPRILTAETIDPSRFGGEPAANLAATTENLDAAVDRLAHRLDADGWTALVRTRPL